MSEMTAAEVYQTHIDRLETTPAMQSMAAVKAAVLDLLYIARNTDELLRNDREEFMNRFGR